MQVDIDPGDLVGAEIVDFLCDDDEGLALLTIKLASGSNVVLSFGEE